MEEDEKIVGVDVAKGKLDVFVGGAHFVVTNDDDGYEHLLGRLKKHKIRVVVLEATGGYEVDVAMALAAHSVPLAVVNPRQVRDFAKSMGYLAKTDKIDARVLAEFGAAARVAPQTMPGGDMRFRWPVLVFKISVRMRFKKAANLFFGMDLFASSDNRV